MKHIWYLYKISNSANSKLYIGVTSNPESRKRAHFYNRSQKSRSLIKNAIDKYGQDNFKFEIICLGNREYIYELERKAIEAYNAVSPNGYNIKPGGMGGQGHSVESRVTDIPIFISGFWFPSIRYAANSLNLNRGTIYNRLKKGTAGDVVQKNNLRIVLDQPVYVGNFWWPCVSVASQYLNKPIPTLRKRIREGFVGEKEKPKQPKGENSHMFGKTGVSCVNSKPVEIEGISYVSITEAVKLSGYSETIIRDRLKKGHEDFKYTEKVNYG